MYEISCRVFVATLLIWMVSEADFFQDITITCLDEVEPYPYHVPGARGDSSQDATGGG